MSSKSSLPRVFTGAAIAAASITATANKAMAATTPLSLTITNIVIQDNGRADFKNGTAFAFKYSTPTEPLVDLDPSRYHAIYEIPGQFLSDKYLHSGTGRLEFEFGPDNDHTIFTSLTLANGTDVGFANLLTPQQMFTGNELTLADLLRSANTFVNSANDAQGKQNFAALEISSGVSYYIGGTVYGDPRNVATTAPAVPEPEAAAILGTGAVIASARRRRRSNAAPAAHPAAEPATLDI